MTSKNNRAPLLYCIKLCASFQSHQRIQTGVTVQRRSIRGGGTHCVSVIGRLRGIDPLFQGMGKNIDFRPPFSRCRRKISAMSSAEPIEVQPWGPSLGQNGHHFDKQQLLVHLLNENDRIPIRISLKFVPKGPIDNKPALVQVMAWRQGRLLVGAKPLSEPMLEYCWLDPWKQIQVKS